MNQAHLELCGGPDWADFARTELLPWATEGIDLGGRLLEVGPGFGVMTTELSARVDRLTAVELDAGLARGLAGMLRGTNVDVVIGDGSRLPLADGSVDAAVSFTMLHHVPSVEIQDALLDEVARVLRPGGVLVGSDSRDGPEFRELHVDDVCVPIDPATFGDRLRAAGFDDARAEAGELGIRFSGRVRDR